jgi:hypothetical protein
MKKLALAIGCGAIVAFSTSGASLAAVRSDYSGAYARVIVWSGGSNVGSSSTKGSIRTRSPRNTDNTYCVDGNCLSR